MDKWAVSFRIVPQVLMDSDLMLQSLKFGWEQIVRKTPADVKQEWAKQGCKVTLICEPDVDGIDDNPPEGEKHE